MTAEILQIPPEDYHAAKALSNSGITHLLDCPARFRAWQDGELGEGQTEAMLIGSAAHCMALEPGQFMRRYHVAAHSGVTAAGKAERKAAADSGLAVLTARQYEEIVPTMNALFRHKKLARLLESLTARREVSIFWDETVNGQVVPCKARLDLIDDVPKFGTVVLDLKFSRSAAPAEFARAIYQRGYHRQGWWYRRALHRAGLEARAFILAAVEKTPPYLVATFELDAQAIELGGRACLEALQTYADCARSGAWPGYPEDIITIDFDNFIYRKEAANDHREFDQLAD